MVTDQTYINYAREIGKYLTGSYIFGAITKNRIINSLSNSLFYGQFLPNLNKSRFYKVVIFPLQVPASDGMIKLYVKLTDIVTGEYGTKLTNPLNPSLITNNPAYVVHGLDGKPANSKYIYIGTVEGQRIIRVDGLPSYDINLQLELVKPEGSEQTPEEMGLTIQPMQTSPIQTSRNQEQTQTEPKINLAGFSSGKYIVPAIIIGLAIMSYRKIK